MAKHIIIEKCNGKCPYFKGYWWTEKGRKYCTHPNIRGSNKIEKGTFNIFPKFCPMDDYEIERCDRIQLKRKKMQDHIKRSKKMWGGKP